MQIIENFELPANVRIGKGSKYFTEEIRETVGKLNVGSGFIIPLIEGATLSQMRSNVPWYIKRHFELLQEPKEFVAIPMPDGKGLAVKRIK